MEQIKRLVKVDVKDHSLETGELIFHQDENGNILIDKREEHILFISNLLEQEGVSSYKELLLKRNGLVIKGNI